MLLFIIEINKLLIYINYINIFIYLYGRNNNLFYLFIRFKNRFCYLVFKTSIRQLVIKLINYSIYINNIVYFNLFSIRLLNINNINYVYFYLYNNSLLLVSDKNKYLIKILILYYSINVYTINKYILRFYLSLNYIYNLLII